MVRLPFVVLLATTVYASAADNQWTSLFDGSTLNGWKAEGNPGAWTVKDGAIRGEDPPGRLMYTGQKCVNCEVKVTVRVVNGAAPGISLRAAANAENGKGYEARMDRLSGFETLARATRFEDGWWTERVVVEGNHIQIFTQPLLNSPSFRSTVDFIDEKNSHTDGYLALLVDAFGPVEFKSIEMRALPAPKIPLAGTWRLKRDSSQLNGAETPAELRILEERNGIRFQSDTGINYFARTDGYDYRVTGSRGYDHVSIQQTDRHYVHEALKMSKIGKKVDPRIFLVRTTKDRKPTGKAAYAVAIDGKTLTVDGIGGDVHYTAVFEKVE